MRSSHSLDRLETAFDDDRLVANAGLLLPATLAQHLGLSALVDAYVDLRKVSGDAHPVPLHRQFCPVTNGRGAVA